MGGAESPIEIFRATHCEREVSLRLAPELNLTKDGEMRLGGVAELEGLVYDAFDALEADIDHL